MMERKKGLLAIRAGPQVPELVHAHSARVSAWLMEPNAHSLCRQRADGASATFRAGRHLHQQAETVSGATGDANSLPTAAPRMYKKPRNDYQTAGPLPPGLSEGLAHRIEQQIRRVYRRSYNAEFGLRTLVHLGVTSMRTAGASRLEMHEALVTRVDNHAGAGKDSIVSGNSHAAALREQIVRWCDEIAVPQTEGAR